MMYERFLEDSKEKRNKESFEASIINTNNASMDIDNKINVSWNMDLDYALNPITEGKS